MPLTYVIIICSTVLHISENRVWDSMSFHSGRKTHARTTANTRAWLLGTLMPTARAVVLQWPRQRAKWYLGICRSLTACQDETWYIGTQSLMYDLFMICLITWHVRVCLGIVEHCFAVLRFRIWWQVAVNSSSTCPESSPGRWRMIFSFHILCCFSLWRIKGWLIKTVTVADAWSMIRYYLYH